MVTAAGVASALAGGERSPVGTTAAGAAAAAGVAALAASAWRPRAADRAPWALAGLAVVPATVAAASAGRPWAL
ncbi:MAG: hypothetical protein ACLGIO_06045, partial [Acidimicrobiia bacterium]